jgi:hypothetical protein
VSPGRELDALVAEKVLGCKPFLGTDGVTKYCNCGRTSSFDDGAHEMRSGGLKPYSTSISAAWELVEHLGEHRGFWFRLEKQASLPGLWLAAFREAGLDDEDTAASVTAPHAIALAALKAVGAM